jgi:hypothetical protein
MAIGARVADQVINRISTWIQKHEVNGKDELALGAGERR